MQTTKKTKRHQLPPSQVQDEYSSIEQSKCLMVNWSHVVNTFETGFSFHARYYLTS